MSDDVVIVGMARTPMGGLLGELANFSAPELGAVAVKAAVKEVRISEELKRYIVDLTGATRKMTGVQLGASPNDLVPFEKYAAAAQSLVRPASGARALQNGALNIERPDKLVQLIARQKGLSHPVIDETVALVDSRLEINRKQAAKA